jgi:hypothetical protein
MVGQSGGVLQLQTDCAQHRKKCLWAGQTGDRIDGLTDQADQSQAAALCIVRHRGQLALRQKAADGKAPGPWRSKIVISSIASEDGNELIATVRAD